MPGRRRSSAIAAALILLVWAGAEASALDEPREDKAMEKWIKESQDQVKRRLEHHKADLRRLRSSSVVKSEVLAKVFPDYLFHSVVFHRYPLAYAPPSPLKPSSLYAVAKSKDQAPQLLTNDKELEAFFKKELPPILEKEQAQDALHAWLELIPALHQDGYYDFSIEKDSTKVVVEDSGLLVKGKVVVKKGGNGEIRSSLVFDKAGKLTQVTNEAKLRPGPRPRCHATKLLDPDPIVREIVEQDLLYMGRAAKPYLDEQRAKASAPLQHAIDRIWQRICQDEP